MTDVSKCSKCGRYTPHDKWSSKCWGCEEAERKEKAELVEAFKKAIYGK